MSKSNLEILKDLERDHKNFYEYFEKLAQKQFQETEFFTTNAIPKAHATAFMYLLQTLGYQIVKKSNEPRPNLVLMK